MRAMAMGVILVLVLAGCGQVSRGVRQSATSINDLRTSVNVAYNELKFYQQQPDPNPQPAQRYCYQFISDIVCYDTEQTTNLSPIVGIQNGVTGRAIGGRSPVSDTSYNISAAAPIDTVITTPNYESMRPLATPTTIEQTPLAPPQAGQNGECSRNGPFPCKESSYVPDANVGK
jgi:hypothetical protein